MNPLPGLLDDPLAQIQDLPDQQYQIAPLRNPRPFPGPNATPLLLEPSAASSSEEYKKSTKARSRDLGPQVAVTGNSYGERTVKPTDINSLIDPVPEERSKLPSYVNLAAVENRGPVNNDETQISKRARVDLGSLLVANPLQLPRPSNIEKNKTKDNSVLPAPYSFSVHALHQPPPNPLLLPPIDPDPVYPELLGRTNTVRSSDNDNILTVDADIDPTDSEDTPVSFSTLSEVVPQKSRRQVTKWSDEETMQLMHGVQIHGIGKWKDILEDPGIKLSPQRTAVDLKDRFRVCCPQAYKARSSSNDVSEYRPRSFKAQEAITPQAPEVSQMKLADLLSLNEEEQAAGPSERTRPPHPRSEKLGSDEIARLGLTEMVHHREKSTSGRRRRRLWTADEDNNLMAGIRKYGYAWTAMQEDLELHLTHRKATDLRDRVRNLFPDHYKNAGFRPVKTKHINEAMATARTDFSGENTTVNPDSVGTLTASNASRSAAPSGPVGASGVSSSHPPRAIHSTPLSSSLTQYNEHDKPSMAQSDAPPPTIAVDQLLTHSPTLQPARGDHMLPPLFSELAEQSWDTTINSAWEEDPI